MLLSERLADGFRLFDRSDTRISNVLQKLVTILVAAMVFGLTLLFSAVLLAAVVVLGSIGWAYLRWKSSTRHRQEPRRGGGHQADGIVLEGEVIREVREHDDRSR
jgi:hypothetical protein